VEDDFEGLARASFRRAGLEASAEDLVLVRAVHDMLLAQLDVLADADPARFPFEPVDPSRAPERT